MGDKAPELKVKLERSALDEMAALAVILISSIDKPGLVVPVLDHRNHISWPFATVAVKVPLITEKFPAAFPSKAPAVPVFNAVKLNAVFASQVPVVNAVAPICDSKTKICALAVCLHCSPLKESVRPDIVAPVLFTSLTPKIGDAEPEDNPPSALSLAAAVP